MITLYTTHCPKCSVIEKKLTAKNIEFNVVDNADEVLNFAQQHNIASAPILDVDGNVYKFEDANKLIKEM